MASNSKTLWNHKEKWLIKCWKQKQQYNYNKRPYCQWEH